MSAWSAPPARSEHVIRMCDRPLCKVAVGSVRRYVKYMCVDVYVLTQEVGCVDMWQAPQDGHANPRDHDHDWDLPRYPRPRAVSTPTALHGKEADVCEVTSRNPTTTARPKRWHRFRSGGISCPLSMTRRLLTFYALLLCKGVQALFTDELKSAHALANETLNKSRGCTIFVHDLLSQAAIRACIALENANKASHFDLAPPPPPPPPPPVPTEQQHPRPQLRHVPGFSPKATCDNQTESRQSLLPAKLQPFFGAMEGCRIWVHLHIPKTGGMSVKETLTSFPGYTDSIREAYTWHGKAAAYLTRTSSGTSKIRNDTVTFTSTEAGLCDGLSWKWDEYPKACFFSVVREPARWAASALVHLTPPKTNASQLTEHMCKVIQARRDYFDRPNIQSCAVRESQPPKSQGQVKLLKNGRPDVRNVTYTLKNVSDSTYKMLILTTVTEVAGLLTYLQERAHGSFKPMAVPMASIDSSTRRCHVKMPNVNDCEARHGKAPCFNLSRAAQALVGDVDGVCKTSSSLSSAHPHAQQLMRARGKEPWLERQYGADLALFRMVRDTGFVVLQPSGTIAPI